MTTCSLAHRRFFCFNDTAPTEIYTLSLHDALPIWRRRAAARRVRGRRLRRPGPRRRVGRGRRRVKWCAAVPPGCRDRSEEHTSELQSRFDLVCRLLLEKKKKQIHEIRRWRHIITVI